MPDALSQSTKPRRRKTVAEVEDVQREELRGVEHDVRGLSGGDVAVEIVPEARGRRGVGVVVELVIVPGVLQRGVVSSAGEDGTHDEFLAQEEGAVG